MSANSLVFVITGCSSGLGLKMALAALAQGHKVIGTVRRADQLSILDDQGGSALLLDITSPQDVLTDFVAKAISRYGHVDVLINSAGGAIGGAVEELSSEEAHAQFNLLFFGALNLTNAFLPHMRERKSGTILNISSHGSVVNVPGVGIYCAAKAALDSISDTWAQELAPWNIRCTSILLGWFNTEAARNIAHANGFGKIDGYTSSHQWVENFMNNYGKETGDVDKAANRIVEIASRAGNLPLRLSIGDDSVAYTKTKAEKLAKEAEEWSKLGIGLNRVA